MNVHIITPYSLDKNIGKAYNEAMSRIPDGDAACIIDYDVMMLLPETPQHISIYANGFPDAVLTCYTNRIHSLSPQLHNGMLNDNADIREHIKIAKRCSYGIKSVKIIDIMSGFLMVVPKHIWQRVPFDETIGLLGVDSKFRQDLATATVPILLMETVYVWHTYRLINGVKDKSHLQ